MAEKTEADKAFEQAVTESAVTTGHRVVLEFDGGSLLTTLICPDDGSCEPATQCGRCAADWTDPDAKRCYDCEGVRPGPCWLQTWFDDAPTEYFSGKVELPVTAEWDCDHPIIRITQPEKAEAPDAR